MEVKEAIKCASSKSFDDFCRMINQIPQLFIEIPDFEFMIKKIQTYDLLCRGQVIQAKCYFESNFHQIMGKEEFTPTKTLFNFLFDLEKYTCMDFVKEIFKEIREEFFIKFEEFLLHLLKKYHILVFYKTDGKRKVNETQEKIMYNFLDSELKLEKALCEFYYELEKKIIEEKNCLTEIHDEIMSSQEKSNQFNIFESLEKLNCCTNCACNFNYNPEKKREEVKIFEVSKDDPFHNFNYLERKVVPQVKKNKRFKNTNEFLKGFNPVFMKKENLDKKIIRRFKKYLKETLLNKKKLISTSKINKQAVRNYLGFDDETNLLRKNSNSTFHKSLASHSTEIEASDKRSSPSSTELKETDFVYDFARKNYLPPFKEDNLKFKSFNTKYLIWLFSNSNIQRLYNDFSNDYGLILSEMIILEYNLKSTEPLICDKLQYYIKNMSRLYGVKSNETEEVDEEQIEKSLSYNNPKSIEEIETKKNNLFWMEENNKNEEKEEIERNILIDSHSEFDRISINANFDLNSTHSIFKDLDDKNEEYFAMKNLEIEEFFKENAENINKKDYKAKEIKKRNNFINSKKFKKNDYLPKKIFQVIKDKKLNELSIVENIEEENEVEKDDESIYLEKISSNNPLQEFLLLESKRSNIFMMDDSALLQKKSSEIYFDSFSKMTSTIEETGAVLNSETKTSYEKNDWNNCLKTDFF